MTLTTPRPSSSGDGGSELLPVLPLRDIVVFPHMIVPLFVGREKSIKALEEVMREEKRILLVAQKNPADDDPAPTAIFGVGTVAQVLQLLKLPDGTVKVLVEGIERAKIEGYSERTEFFEAKTRMFASELGESQETEALARTAVAQVERRIRSRVKRQMEKTQREYYLNEQMKAIQKELGDGDERDELNELDQKIKNAKLSKEARERAEAELKKLRQMSPMSAEAT